jgi:isocitrate dehydrogenase kinase/phosphatase
VLFSFARAYFFVDMEVPAGYVSFLRWLMPRKPRAELSMFLSAEGRAARDAARDRHGVQSFKPVGKPAARSE